TEAIQQQVTQGPTCTISGKTEGKIMNVEIAMLVGKSDFLGIFFKAVTGLNRSGHVQHQSLKGMAHVGVFIYTPVGTVKVTFNGSGDIKIGFILTAQFTA
ncbi:hypothetical protein ADUPG1_005496, partial [Aduncisulcus paluster]